MIDERREQEVLCLIGSDTIGYEVRTLDNLLFRMLLAYSAKAGMDELTDVYKRQAFRSPIV